MSVWIKCADRMPPLGEDVLILYKDKEDELSQNNLYYGISARYKDTILGTEFERWSYFTEYQGYYEVVYWTPLVDMPNIDKESGEDGDSD